MPRHDPVISCKSRGSYGAHVLDHLAADGAGFAGGQVAIVALLQVKIFTGETTEKYLRKLESRTGHITRDLAEQSEKPDAAMVSSLDDSMGHMSKKMIEAYERNMK